MSANFQLRALGLVAILVAGVTPVARASTCGDTAACLLVVESAQQQVQSLSARFVQTKTLSLLEEPIRSTGVFAFQRPDRVLWRMDDPPFEVRIEGNRVRLPAGEQAAMGSIPPGLESLLDGISAMFAGDMQRASQRFDIEAAQHDEGIVVRMVPKRAADRRLIDSIRLTFVSAAIELRRIQLDESVGDHLEIVFDEVHRNDATAETLFRSR